MLNVDTRSLILSAVAHRLVEIGEGPVASSRPASAGVREEDLRWLMVHALPKLKARQHDAEFRRQVCERLVWLAPCAANGDIRFLDAMNVYYEETARLDGWREERGWPGVLASYRHALLGFAASVRAGARGPAAAPRNAVADGPRQRAFERHSNQVAPRTVLVLADDLLSGLKIERTIGRASGISVHVLVCNNQARPMWRFWAGRLRDLRRSGIVGAARAFELLFGGRLHVRGSRLHDERTVSWLRRRGFWIGVHAMGVIYRQSVLRQFTRGVLNAHIGLLPEYRGRSVMEWSILAGDSTGITVFFMDEGIDTGADIVIRREVELPAASSVAAAKRYLFELCPEAYGEALHEFVQTGRTSLNAGGRRYYVMSGTLLAIVDELLRSSGASQATEEGLQKADVFRRVDEVLTGIAV